MIADYLPADSAQDPNTQDPHRMVQCAAQPNVLWVQHHCGLYRSTSGGQPGGLNNSASGLCIFDRRVRPLQHRLAAMHHGANQVFAVPP